MWLKNLWSAAIGWSTGALGWLALGVGLMAIGAYAGYDIADNACKARRLSAIEQQHKEFVQAVIDGGLDAKALRDELVAAESTNAQLKERLKHVPTIASVAPTPGCPVCDARFTVGAVGLWNDALTGVPTSACGSAGAAEEACAAASTASADDAAANHAQNAADCREDRTRYQRLIDHITKRESQR